MRAHLGARAPKEAVINGARYSMRLFRSSNGRHVRTFYPVFLGPADGNGGGNGGNGNGGVTTVVKGNVRIIAALINPEGHDPGRESVTLINVRSAPQALDGWRLEDRNAKTESLSGKTIGAGETLRVTLDGSGTQLSNKGGKIGLLDAAGNSVHIVDYSRRQARADGVTILF